MTIGAAVVGVAVGVAYTLSPLFVVTGLGFALVLRWAARVADPDERRWVLAVLGVAILLRVAAIGGLFLSADHSSAPFAFLFGDEDYFIRRSIWLRNSALGIPISPADAIYAFDRAISTSLLWLLATLHLLFGPSPYGVRLVSALLYIAGAVALYRAVRPSFGFPAAFIGFLVLLFLPSLFVWSVSVLKEPLFFAILAGMVTVTIKAAQNPSWSTRVLAAPILMLGAYAAQTVREGGLIVAALGTIAGVLLGSLLSRPRLLLATTVLAVAVAFGVVSGGSGRDRLVTGLATAALGHWEQVNAPGHSYLLFEPGFYLDRPVPGSISVEQGVGLVTGGLAAYILTPTPAASSSRAQLAYLPEQIVWYLLVALAPIGVWAGLRRDPFLTGLLLAHLGVAVLLVALNSGNIGTLVRHRALALPCLVWFSGLGATFVVARMAKDAPVTVPMTVPESGA